jgi:CDP-diglyceride synthetase
MARHLAGVLPLVVTWLCDSFAMWGGMLIGGPKMARPSARVRPGPAVLRASTEES